MKITDVTITLFSWDNLPADQLGRHMGKMPAGRSDLGLVNSCEQEGIAVAPELLAIRLLARFTRDHR